MEERHYSLPGGRNGVFFLKGRSGFAEVDQIGFRWPEKLVCKGFVYTLNRERLRK